MIVRPSTGRGGSPFSCQLTGLRNGASAGQALPMAEGGRFHPITARLHAAPTPSSVPGDLVEEEATGRICAALDSAQLAIAEEIARRLGDRCEQLAWQIETPTKLLHEPALCPDKLRVAAALAKEFVDGGQSGLWYATAGKNPLKRFTQAFAED